MEEMFIKKLRDKLILGQIEINELEHVLENPSWKDQFHLDGDDWRDFLDYFDWEKLGPNNLVNIIFNTTDIDNSGIEEIGYFGIHTFLGMIANSNFSHENLLRVYKVLNEAASDLDTYGDIFLDFCDEETFSDWLDLYKLVASKLDQLDQRSILDSDRKLLQKFLKGNFE